MAAYAVKVTRVEANVKRLREEVAKLYHKKKEIENLKIQKKLEAQLRDAQGDLGTLDGALNHVKTEADKFDKKKEDVQSVIVNLQGQLDKVCSLSSFIPAGRCSLLLCCCSCEARNRKPMWLRRKRRFSMPRRLRRPSWMSN